MPFDWHRGISLPGILHFCAFFFTGGFTEHHPSELGSRGFIGKEEPAFPSFTQQSETWSSVSLHPDNGFHQSRISLGMTRGLRSGNSARPMCLVGRPHHQEGTSGWTHKPLHSLPGWNCCSQASVTVGFSKQGVVCGCSCPPGRRNCNKCQNLKRFVRYYDFFDIYVWIP